MTESRLAHEVWQVIKDEDWVLTANTLKEWVHKVWDFDKPYRHVGRELGTGTQIGMSIGVALAHKGSGKLVVDLQPDGDLMFDWARYGCQSSTNPDADLMYNNRAYYNDWAHQIHMAHQRGTDPRARLIGMDLEGPPPDFRAHRQRHRVVRRRPIEDPAEVGPALKRAIDQVKSRQTGAGRRHRLAPRRKRVEKEDSTTKFTKGTKKKSRDKAQRCKG